jgi:nucleoside-diphosphate-sugar epimerase
MKIFLAGATGAVGRSLVPLLVARGHHVVGTTRRQDRFAALRAAGAEPVALDVLDADAVRAAVAAAAPDVIVHQATALDGLSDVRHFADAFAQTNRLRTEGTDHLLAAARAAGVRRVVAQSFAGWPYERRGGPAKTEEDPLDPDPPAQLRTTLAAIRHLEAGVTGTDGIEGIALRYGGFYGPGTGLAPGGDQYETVRKRRFPLIGAGTGVWSFIHIEDAAAATLAALEHGGSGIYNVVDDEPAPVAEWLPYLARSVGAKPPRHLPAWLGRIVAGEHVVALMTEVRGAANGKARRELGWAPRVGSWRDGFAALGH